MSNNQKTILIIEDEGLLNSLLEEELTDAGFEMLSTLTGEEGMEILNNRGEDIDVLLLDLMLPKVDGFQVLKKIGNDEKLQGIKIIVLSNLGDQPNIDKAMDMGADEYYVKANMVPEEIVTKVKEKLSE